MIKFTRSYAIYNAGETATFSVDYEARLIALRVAVAVTVAPDAAPDTTPKGKQQAPRR